MIKVCQQSDIDNEPLQTVLNHLNLDVSSRTLRRQFKRQNLLITRCMCQTSSVISATNLGLRVAYGTEHRGKTVRDFWQCVYFTDEVHFNSVDLYDRRPMEWRRAGQKPTAYMKKKKPFNVTFHVTTGISYNGKGWFTFYNDPVDQPKIKKPQKPRKWKSESEEEYEQRVQQHNAAHTHFRLNRGYAAKM